MAVVFDANATADATANGVTSINTSNLTIGSGSNRALVAQIVWSGTVTSPALKWDNAGSPQSLAAITGASGTNTARVDCWGLVAPTSGAKQLNAAWTTARDVCVNGVSWTGVDQTGGATSFPNGTSATGAGVTSSVSVTSATNDAVMAVFSNVTDLIDAVNNTQTFRDNTPATMGGAGNRAAGAASVSMTATNHVSSTWAAAGCSLKAAGAGPAFLPTLPVLAAQAVNRACEW